MNALNSLSLVFQSTPSARRATVMGWPCCARAKISIHALREESDSGGWWFPATTQNFNPRPPRGERLSFAISVVMAAIFQSTPSARRATLPSLPFVALAVIFQSTPSARRATTPDYRGVWDIIISIHALREESDDVFPDTTIAQEVFQSTPSARRATLLCFTRLPSHCISIHALREESDSVVFILMPPM